MIERKSSDVATELKSAAEAERAGDFSGALAHLMKAHGLGQAVKRDHVRIHWRMCAFALRRRRFAEALNQLTLAFGAAVYVMRTRLRINPPSERPAADRPQVGCR